MQRLAADSEVEGTSPALEARRSLDASPLLACTMGYEQSGVNRVLGSKSNQVSVPGCGVVHAVSLNSRGRAIFDINEDFCRFECLVAINNDVPAGAFKADFAVLTDGKEVAAARGVTAGDLPRPIAAELGNARVLELRAHTNQAGFGHAVWLDPILIPNPLYPSGEMVDSNGRTLPGEYRLSEFRMTELEALAIGLNTDKGTLHSYLPYYNRIFDAYRRRVRSEETIALLEIGVFEGGSVHLWRDYFGPQLNLHCMDLNIPRGLPRGTSLHLGNACDEIFIKSHLAQIYFDIIIDDGSHAVEDQIRTFLLLRPFLKLGGVYIIEDMQSVSFVERIESETSTQFEVLDLREKKNRYDDVLLVYSKKA
jgi:NPCBM/NEW2 domain